MKKRFISMLLLLCMIISICSGMTISASAETTGNFTYSIINGNAIITGIRDGAVINGECIIPSNIDNHPVTGIGDYAFFECQDLNNVIIPNGVISIGESAFCQCYNLTNVSIPDSVIIIETGAFYMCSKLTNLIIPNSVTTISWKTFYGCKKLNNVIIPDGVVRIERDAFYDCDSFTNIAIPDSVISIGYGAFSSCGKLANITISDSVIDIGADSFWGTAYYNDSDNWTNGLLYIGNHMIKAKDDVTSVDLKSETKSIAEGAFYDCSNLVNITIPEGVIGVGQNAFTNTAYYNDSDNWTNGLLYIDNHLIKAKDYATSVDLKSTTKTIAGEAFKDCDSLTSITIPNSVYSIGNYAFAYCRGLTNIIIPHAVCNIGDYAFSNCTNLTNIILPNTIKSIGIETFAQNNLTSITLPDSVTSIGYMAFYGCGYLDTVVIPDSVTHIDARAFKRCGRLTNISLSNSVKIIGTEAFEGCSKLKDVYYTGDQKDWGKIGINCKNTDLINATIHYNYVAPVTSLSISAPTNSYAGTYYTFEATFDAMPTSAFLQFDSPADDWTWFSDEYCSTNPVFNIPTDEIVEKDGKYVYQTSFVIYSSGNVNDNYNRQVRVAADINDTRQYSEGAKFVVQPTPERQKNTIGYLYEQTSNPSGDTVAPEINDVEVTKSNGKYRLTIKDITAENEDWVFFYWQTDIGEFEKVTDDFKTVDLTVSGDANVTVTMGDGCGYITTKTIEIN